MRQIILWASILTFISCVPVIKEQPTPTAKPEDAPWKSVSAVSLEQPIRGMYATPFELYFLTNNQFARLDSKLALLEKRLLPTDLELYGAPMMNDNVFARIVLNNSNKSAVEFHLARNPQNSKIVTTDNFLDATKQESLLFDREPTSRPGCFTADGTQLLLVGTLTPANKPYAVLLNVQFNFNFTNIYTVTVAKRYDLPNLGLNRVESVRFINGNFYLATKDGGYRLTPSGDVKKLFNHWTLDFFNAGNTLYASAFNSFDFHSSADNGVSWKRGSISELKYVIRENNRIFSQISRAQTFGLADTTMTKVQKMKYNADLFKSREVVDYHVKYFNGKYFINDGKLVYAVDSVTVLK